MRQAVTRAGVLACVVVSAPVWAAVAADKSALARLPADRLVESAKSGRVTTYQGVVIYRGDDSFDVLRIDHRFKDDSERERMVSLTGEPRQLLRIDDRVISILPKGRSMSVDRPSLKGLLSQIDATRIEKLRRFYDFRDLGPGRIADRACSGVAIAPRDDLRYGYEIWLDDEKHLPLKVTLVGPHAEVLEQVMFTEISFPATIADETFETEVDTSRFSMVARSLPSLVAPATPPLASGTSVVRLEQLPPGFEIVSRDEHPIPDRQGRVEHILLSDGLSAISVFAAIEQSVTAETATGPAPVSAKPFRGVSHLGPVQAYGRMVGTLHITIIGEVPQQTVRLIGDGLQATLPVPAGLAPAH